jgi:hypothetical protein
MELFRQRLGTHVGLIHACEFEQLNAYIIIIWTT